MIKKIVLKLKSISYSGNSIGDDIRLEINILGKPFSLKKKIKVGTKQEFDKIIGEFDTDRKTFFEAEKWKVGIYDIEIPDAPHEGGINYTKIAKFAKVWFRVGHKDAKYLHTGMHSLGCITVLEQDKWDEIFHQLIKARKGDGLSVGVLEVVD